MTEQQEKLVEVFNSLSDDRKSLLELVSVAYFSLSRTEILQIANGQNILQPSVGDTLDFGDLRPAATKLLELGLFVENSSRLECNPLIKEAMMHNAERMGRLDRWIEATVNLSPRTAFSNSMWSVDGEFRLRSEFIGMRNSIHKNDSESFLASWSKWKRILTSQFSSGMPDVPEIVLFHPFDCDWLLSRDPKISDVLLSEIIEPKMDKYDPIQDIMNVVKKLIEKGKSGTRLTELGCEYLLLSGEVERGIALLEGMESWSAMALRGWASCVQGCAEEAVSQFQEAIRRYRKQTRKRIVVLPPRMGAFYAVALLCSTAPGRFSLAHEYLDLALRKGGEEFIALYRALKSAVYCAEGRTEAARDLAWQASGIERLAGTELVLALAALACVDKGFTRVLSMILVADSRQALRDGYAWVALEASRVRARVCGPGAALGAGTDLPIAASCHPVLAEVQARPKWESALEALAKVNSTTSQRSRLTWRISRTGTLAPFHQIRTKNGGWTKGRRVALKRLYDRSYDGSLTAQDEALRNAVNVRTKDRTYGGTEYVVNLDRALPALVGHPFVYRHDDPDVRVEVVRGVPRLEVATEGRDVRLALVPLAPGNGSAAVAFESERRAIVSTFGPEHRRIIDVIGRGGLTVPVTARDALVRAIAGASRLVPVNSDIDVKDEAVDAVAADCSTRFNISPYADGLRVEPRVLPLGDGGPALRPGKGGKSVFATVSGKAVRASRDLEQESRCLGTAVSACPTLADASWDGRGWTLADPESSLELLDELHGIGGEVTIAWPQGQPMRIRHRASSGSLSLKIRGSRDWFDVSGSVETDMGLVLDLKHLLACLPQAHGRFVPIGDGAFVALTDRFRARIQQLAFFGDPGHKDLRFHRSRAHLLEALAQDTGSVDAGVKWRRLVSGLRSAEALDPPIPSTLRVQLRDYQVLGYRWAQRLAEWGAGACLADDMGLGKTVQALAVMASRASNGPALVVAPKSVCPNWIDETRRFAPSLKPIAFGPGNREAIVQGLTGFDLLVCSYGLLRQEQDLLSGVRWETVVLDEAQAIKNRDTQLSGAAMRISAGFRMITTGTPVENHLGELWNLFHFLNPGLLGSAGWFNREFAIPIHQRQDIEKARRLKRLLRPVVLRRTKSEVLDELPPRTEITLPVEMSVEELSLYEAVRQHALESLQSEGDGTRPSHIRILAEITKLRQACCHPQLVLPDSQVPSSKLAMFGEIVSELIEGGHKALVFSQFVRHLKIVARHLDGQGVSYRYLDGSMSARRRKQEVNRFQSGDGDLFLISLRAGGHGLNLTAADYVIHLDPWWNPAVEDQASDRAHRIGQTRPVTIYRLVVKGSIEEAILDLHKSKRDVANSLLRGADVAGKMSAAELLELIRGG